MLSKGIKQLKSGSEVISNCKCEGNEPPHVMLLLTGLTRVQTV